MNQVSNLYRYDSYTIPDINFILSSYIREYDINKANISILRKYKYINDDEYHKYYNMDKIDRNISIGLLMRDNKEIRDGLIKGFELSRKEFFEANNIEDHHVFSIKKDAIYLINKTASELEFNGVNFSMKNIYSSFYKVLNLEMYYYLDSINDISKLEIKGINDDKLIYHKDFMIDFLKYLFEVAETSGMPSEQIIILNNFYRMYLNLELDPGYYREFNASSMFKIISKTYKQYQLNTIDMNNLKYLDITRNMNILRILNSYYSIMWGKFMR